MLTFVALGRFWAHFGLMLGAVGGPDAGSLIFENHQII